MHLENLQKRKNKTGKSKRLGRGYGSGVGGHTVGRGQKGQKSRSGHKSMALFEGGNKPFYKKTPKYRGFNRPGKVVFKAINLGVIDKNYKAGEIVSIESLVKKGLIGKKESNVKILAHGDLTKKITIKGIGLSEVARKYVLKLKGKIE